MIGMGLIIDFVSLFFLLEKKKGGCYACFLIGFR